MQSSPRRLPLSSTGHASRGSAWTPEAALNHTAILARSLKVPAVVGLHDASSRIAAGTPVILDGTTGDVVVAPAAQAIEDAQRHAAAPRRRHAPPSHPHDREPLTTADGVPIRLEANVELLEDLEFLREDRYRAFGSTVRSSCSPDD